MCGLKNDFGITDAGDVGAGDTGWLPDLGFKSDLWVRLRIGKSFGETQS